MKELSLKSILSSIYREFDPHEKRKKRAEEQKKREEKRGHKDFDW